MSLRYMNEPKLNEFKKELLRQFKKVREIEESYLSEKPNENSEQKFIAEMETIIK